MPKKQKEEELTETSDEELQDDEEQEETNEKEEEIEEEEEEEEEEPGESERRPTLTLAEFEGKIGIIPVYNLDGDIIGKAEVSEIFRTPVRSDVIKRAVLSYQSKKFQPQGRDHLAGKKTSAESRGVGLGLARVPRVKGSGTRRTGQAAFAPGTVGGRVSHPPRPEKVIIKHISYKERKLALKSAISATGLKDYVLNRGHRIGAISHLPIIVENRLETINNTKKLKETLIALSLDEELQRIEKSRKIRAGKGKNRGRKIKHAKGPLLIVSEDKGISKAASNIPGVDSSNVKSLNAELLAPGTHPGRLTIWSEAAFQNINNLFN